MIAKYLVILCLVVSLNYSQQCKCIPVDYSSAEILTQNYDEIYIAKILKIKTGSDLQLKVTLKILTVFKSNNNLKRGQKITISTCENSACCGISFELYKNYLIYSNERSANSCSPTKLLKDSTELNLLKDYFNIIPRC